MPPKLLLAISLIAALPIFPSNAETSEPENTVSALIERILPGHSKDFIVETIETPPEEDVFEVEASENGKIVLRGNSPLSQAVAFNWYLKHDAFVSVSWYADDAVSVPPELPLPKEKTHKTTKQKNRFFLNYCTFGYSMPYWRWRDWERFIDWMALNGINLPLAQTGNEYVWQKVWKEYGLTDGEIRKFFSGPSHLPWHHMSNLDGGPDELPQSYIDGQHALQKQILQRERSLGMTPVLCAFAGHVPGALKTRFPSANIKRLAIEWGKYPACWFLDPMDPLFKEIETKFITEQTKEYGTDHWYATDPFNEIAPPKWDAGYLAGVAKAIYEGMAEADPEAIWMQMSWTFFVDRKQWTNERLSAMINAAPKGHMVILDYVSEANEGFRSTENYFGAPFIWNYLGNYGGNTSLIGPINKINDCLTRAMNDPALANFSGVGGTLEGLNNPVVYELPFNRVWEGPQMDLSQWVRDQARARAGGPDPKVEQAWELLREKFLKDKRKHYINGVIFQVTHPALRPSVPPDKGDRMVKVQLPYANEDLAEVWSLLLQAGPKAQKSSAYRRDLIDTTRQVLGNLGLNLRDKMAEAYDKKDIPAFEKASEEFMTLGGELEKFLGTSTEFMLGKWIGDARSWAADESEKAYYEKDAREILSVWNPSGSLTDYANRQWSGLMADYYLPRWQILIDATLAEMKTGVPVNIDDLHARYRAHDLQFAGTTGGNYPEKPLEDPVAMSRALYSKYAPVIASFAAGTTQPPK